MIVAALSWSVRAAETNPLTGDVTENPRDRGPGPSELAALEHALHLAQRWHAQVVAATVGPPEAGAMLRDALAAGAAEALRVDAPGAARRFEPAHLVGGCANHAAALATALRRRYGTPELVLCGDRSVGRGTGSFPAFLAAELDAEQALGVVRIQPANDDNLTDHALYAYRRLDGGRREVLRVRPPAVVSVEAAGVRLRRAGLPATLASGQAAIPVDRMPQAAPLPRIWVRATRPYRPRPREIAGPAGPALRRLHELTSALDQRTPPTVVGPLPPDQAADELLGYLRRHGYLDAGDPA